MTSTFPASPTDPAGSTRTSTRAPGAAERIASLLTLTAVVVLLVVSGMVLIAAGIPYASAGGSLVSKIHPATWLVTVAVACRLVALGGPRVFFERYALDRPGIAVFTLATGVLFFHCIVVVKLPLSAVIDNFALPILLFIAIDLSSPRDRDRLTMLVHGILIADLVLGCFEYASGWRLTPMYDTNGVAMSYDWRSTALFGHPLTNAFQTGSYLVALAAGAAPRLSPTARLALMALAGAGLIAFGGRAAMVTSLAIVGLIGAIGAARLLAGRRFEPTGAAAALLMATVVAVAAVIYVDSGGADRFLQRFVQDHGSAATRVSMLRIFTDLTMEQFLLWPDPALIAQAQQEYDLKIGIESTEVAFVAFYGLLMTIVFFAGLAAFIAEMVRATSPASLWQILLFFVVMSASTGLANKSPSLAFLTITLLAIMPRPPFVGRGSLPVIGGS